jgi:16S rRNA processing protein RimM
MQAGRVGRAHGLDGSFYVTGALPRLLTLGATVSVGGQSAEIVRRAGTDARPIVRLQGIEDRAAAEALRGMALTVAATGAPQLGEGEWWAHELEGCDVFDGGLLLGTVARLIELPSCEAIEVDGRGGGGPLLVPLVRDAIRHVDVAAGRIEVNGDFLDLDARQTSSGGRPARTPRSRRRAPPGGSPTGAEAGAGAGAASGDGDAEAGEGRHGD